MSVDASSVPAVEPRGHLAASRRILAGIVVTMFVSGLVNGIADERQLPEPMWWTIVSAFLSSFLTFCWFRLDRDARGLRRSLWVNVAILLLEPVAIVVYVLASRPRGQKLRALGRLFGFFLLLLLATMLGMMAAFMVA